MIRRPGNRINRIFSVAIGLFFVVILGVVVLGQGSLLFAYSQRRVLNALVSLPLALAALLSAAWLRGRFSARTVCVGWWRWLPIALFPALLLVQLVIASSVWFYPGWDIFNVYDNVG